MKISRIKEIEEYIINNETVTMEQLCDVFGMSMNTVRRDINDLVLKGTVKKVYGGVTVSKPTLVSFDERNIKNQEIKESIAARAAEFVDDGDIIYIDSGTTTMNMVKYLNQKSVTIITNSLNVMINSIQFTKLNIISIGGTLSRKTNSFYGFGNMATLQDFNINKAFMATTGISLSSGLTNSLPLEYEIKKLVADKSQLVYVLADSTKFNVSSLLTFCKLKDVDCIITEKQPPKDYVDYFQQNEIKISIP